MGYLFLTGATGLLGSYLIRDLTRKGIRLAVLVRPTKFSSAKQRIEDCMVRWEKIAGHALPRPVVLEGDISRAGFGLSDIEKEWVAKHCHSLMHNAASLTFQEESPEGEPWKSNVRGTQHVLSFCEETGIRKFHHVSTAYVCGLRTDLAKENELDIGQEFGNDYEISKVQAETFVRNAQHIDSATFYRPAIIIGDSKDGYTSTFHGFYVPLKILSSLVTKTAALGLTRDELTVANVAVGNRLRELMGLDGTENKNYVPVDWVSEVMAHIYAEENHHGKTYHLSPQNRVPVSVMHTAFGESLTDSSFKQKVTIVPEDAEPVNWDEFEKHFVSQMKVYRSYWRDDPLFDTTNTNFAAPHLPCPIVDDEMLDKMCQYALDSNFGWPRPQSEIPELNLHELFEISPISKDHPHVKVIANIEITGAGGGQWKILEDDQQNIFFEEGVDEKIDKTIYLNGVTFSNLLNDHVSIEEAKVNGDLYYEGSTTLDNLLKTLLKNLMGQEKQLSIQ